MTVGEHQCAAPRCRGCGKRVGEEHEAHCVCVSRPDYYPAPPEIAALLIVAAKKVKRG